MIILTLIGWSGLGAIIFLLLYSLIENDCFIDDAEGLEFLNPIFIYKHSKKLNIFGAIFLALIFNALCPFATISFWLYKLCTCGRKPQTRKDNYIK